MNNILTISDFEADYFSRKGGESKPGSYPDAKNWLHHATRTYLALGENFIDWEFQLYLSFYYLINFL